LTDAQIVRLSVFGQQPRADPREKFSIEATLAAASLW
jgi:hypothetical protein